jgi:two-component sensor histidine kinase
MITLLFGLLVASLLMVVARLLTQQAIEDQESLDWLEEQNSIRNSLTRELNHRVKNTLANVLSIVSLTRRRATDIDQFAEALDGRIRALSATHDLLTQSEWGATPIRAVIEAELAPYVRNRDEALELAGPHVELAPNDALSLGLAIHELATNAAKYGALSVSNGHVRATWVLEQDTLASVRWVESGGPAVAPERQRGFGTELIEKIVAHELRHPVDLQFDPEGVRCTLMVPVRQPSEFELRARSRAMRGSILSLRR